MADPPEGEASVKEIEALRYQFEFEHLGGRLADRAFLNLPHHIRQLAYQWGDMSLEEQEVVLTMLGDELRSSQWHARRASNAPALDDAVIPDANGAFPALTKSWKRGPYMPNCLGMAQMLVGFARAAGVRHSLITPLVPSWYSAMVTQRKQIAYNLRQLDTFPDAPYVRKWRRRLVQFDKSTLETMLFARDELAHHALVIEVADGTSRMVDPYLNAYGEHEALTESDVMSTWTRTYRARGVVSFSYEAVQRAVAWTEQGKRPRTKLQMIARLAGYDPPRTKRQRERAYDAMIECITEYCRLTVNSRVADVPTVYELTTPAVALAAYTLNHWSVVSKIPGDDIVTIIGLQHILRDQIAHLKDYPGFSEWMSENIDAGALLPELRPYYVSIKKGTHHDKEGNAEEGPGGCSPESDA